jgi:hypothetical protein
MGCSPVSDGRQGGRPGKRILCHNHIRVSDPLRTRTDPKIEVAISRVARNGMEADSPKYKFSLFESANDWHDLN